jgi:hypothetical protein
MPTQSSQTERGAMRTPIFVVGALVALSGMMGRKPATA